jgi:hypothetical protein
VWQSLPERATPFGFVPVHKAKEQKILFIQNVKTSIFKKEIIWLII